MTSEEEEQFRPFRQTAPSSQIDFRNSCKSSIISQVYLLHDNIVAKILLEIAVIYFLVVVSEATLSG